MRLYKTTKASQEKYYHKVTHKFLALFFRCGEKKKIQIFAKNTNIHLNTSSLFHENGKWLNFIIVNKF